MEMTNKNCNSCFYCSEHPTEPTLVICNQVPEEPVALNNIDVSVLVNECI